MTLEFEQENLTGSSCSGSDGESNRILTLSNTRESKEENFSLYLDGLFLQETVDYTIDHKPTETQITFLIPIWDTQKISSNYYVSVIQSSSSMQQDVKDRIEEHGQKFTLKRYTETTDSMGSVTASTSESYTIYSVIQNITKKDRKIHEMGLAIAGNVKALFYHEYEDSMTGNGDLIVQAGDVLEESSGKQWRIVAIDSEKYAYGTEILRTGVLRSISLEQ